MIVLMLVFLIALMVVPWSTGGRAGRIVKMLVFFCVDFVVLIRIPVTNNKEHNKIIYTHNITPCLPVQYKRIPRVYPKLKYQVKVTRDRS